MPPQTVADIVALMRLQYQFARTGQGWEEYAAAREKLAARMGTPPDTFPGTPDHPYWQFIRRSYFYDPAPTLRQLQVPTLALFGELDNNIVAEKNKAAWEAALKAGGNRDYTLRIAEGESLPMGGEGRKQRGGQVAPAIRAGLLHDDRGLAREADSGLPLTCGGRPGQAAGRARRLHFALVTANSNGIPMKSPVNLISAGETTPL